MIVIANWKQNKTFADLKEWIETFDANVDKSVLNSVEIVVAPSHPLILPFKMITQGYPYIKIASQDVSAFEKGAHTGEVGAFQLTNIAQYSIIGHSERRTNGETADIINLKIDNAQKAQIQPVVCFSKPEEFQAVEMRYGKEGFLFAYEPENAISTAANSTGPISAEEVKEMVGKIGLDSVIYGGSVDENSVDNYLKQPFINGFLVGGASLDPVRFAKIVSKSA